MAQTTFEEALALAREAVAVLGTGKLRDPAIRREGPRSFPSDDSNVQVDLKIVTDKAEAPDRK